MWLLLILVAIFLVVLIVGLSSVLYGEEGRHDTPRRRSSEQANDYAGRTAETYVNGALRSLLEDNEYLLENLLIPLRNGYKTEIDAVLITRKGIFCIETKSWMGSISGSDEDEYWLQAYRDESRGVRKHRNPVKQNEAHCRVLKETLNDRFDVENVVIFFDLEDGEGIDSDYVFAPDEFLEAYETWDDRLLPMSIRSVYQRLQSFVATKEQLEKHKRELEERFKN